MCFFTYEDTIPSRVVFERGCTNGGLVSFWACQGLKLSDSVHASLTKFNKAFVFVQVKSIWKEKTELSTKFTLLL